MTNVILLIKCCFNSLFNRSLAKRKKCGQCDGCLAADCKRFGGPRCKKKKVNKSTIKDDLQPILTLCVNPQSTTLYIDWHNTCDTRQPATQPSFAFVIIHTYRYIYDINTGKWNPLVVIRTISLFNYLGPMMTTLLCALLLYGFKTSTNVPLNKATMENTSNTLKG